MDYAKLANVVKRVRRKISGANVLTANPVNTEEVQPGNEEESTYPTNVTPVVHFSVPLISTPDLPVKKKRKRNAKKKILKQKRLYTNKKHFSSRSNTPLFGHLAFQCDLQGINNSYIFCIIKCQP